VISGVTANVVVGAGGNADSQSNGGQTQLDTNNDGTFEWSANGGNIGGGWDTRAGGSAGSASPQSGATVLTGGNGGKGPSTQIAGSSADGSGFDGFTSDITGTSYRYGGVEAEESVLIHSVTTNQTLALPAAAKVVVEVALPSVLAEQMSLGTIWESVVGHRPLPPTVTPGVTWVQQQDLMDAMDLVVVAVAAHHTEMVVPAVQILYSMGNETEEALVETAL
jgi:hypothetical protein